MIGFEVDLANAIGRQTGREARLVLCGWDQILSDLDRGDIDLALNGYEYTAQRARQYAASIPYYIYELGLCVRQGLADRFLVGASATDVRRSTHRGSACSAVPRPTVT